MSFHVKKHNGWREKAPHVTAKGTKNVLLPLQLSHIAQTKIYMYWHTVLGIVMLSARCCARELIITIYSISTVQIVSCSSHNLRVLFP
jgi:hypothetical protein